MIVPETTAHVINYLVNHESIKPWVCGQIEGVLDVTPLIQNSDNYFFTDEVGGCGFIKLSPGRFELHSFCLPEARGKWTKDRFAEVRDWMFSHTDATEIVTMVPHNNLMARGAARMCKFTKYAKLENAWPYNGKVYDIDMYVLFKEVV